MIRVLAFLRSFLAALIYPLVVLIFAALIVGFGIVPSMRKLQDWIIAVWAKLSLVMFGVELEGSGLEKLPPGSYLGLFNHTSNFDILAVQVLIPRIRFGAKIELFRIPIFGHAMAAAKALPIARSKIQEVMKVYEQAKGRLAQGECFILSPEGTRQVEEKLGPFKSGPFLFAIQAQVPVVPIALIGASQIQPKGMLLPNRHQLKSKIRVIVGEPIPTNGMTEDSKKLLQEKVLESFHQLGLS
jgi:1-acyl-sn-glycerol-3-phosphate acyltransferase